MIQVQFAAHEFTLKAKGSKEEKDAAEACAEKLTVEVMAKSILLGWSGNVRYKGAILPYSVDNAIMLLQLKDFRAKVEKLSGDFQNYRLVSEEEDAKNSEATSNGSSIGVATSSTTSLSSVI